MSYKFKHSFAAALAVVLVVGFLPINALVVRADENDVYYLYRDVDSDVGGIGKEIPDNAYKVAVFVNGGTYDLQEDDYRLFVNNGIVNASTDDILSDEYKFTLAGRGKVVSDELTLSTLEDESPAYPGEFDFVSIEDYFNAVGKNDVYTFTSDYRLSENPFKFDNLVIPEGVTLTIGSYESFSDNEDLRGTVISVGKNIIVDGTLDIEGVSNSMFGVNTLELDDFATGVVGPEGKIIGGAGACIDFSGWSSSIENFTVYTTDYNDELVEIDNAEVERQVFYDPVRDKWIVSNMFDASGFFKAQYKFFDGGAFLNANGKDIYDSTYYSYDADEEIDFVVTVPEQRAGETPEVQIISNNGRTSEYPELTENGSEYTFSYTPDYPYGFTVCINWCEFDALSSDDNSFCLDIEGKGSINYDVAPSGEFYVEPHNDDHTRYRIDKDCLEDGVVITVTPDEGHEIAEIMFDFNYYDLDEAFEYIDCIDEVDGGITITLNNDNFYDSWLYMEFTADDGMPDDPGYDDPDAGTFKVQYRQFKIVNGEMDRYVDVNGTIIDPRYQDEDPQTFTVGEPLVFTLHAPESRIGLKRIVQIYDGKTFFYSTEVDGDNNIVVTDDQFTFTPTSKNGFTVYVNWCAYDEIHNDHDNVMIETTVNGNGTVSAEKSVLDEKDPYYENEGKILVPTSVIDDDGAIVVAFVPEEGYELKNVWINKKAYCLVMPDSYYESYNKFLISEDPNFEFVDGHWIYRITELIGSNTQFIVKAEYGRTGIPRTGEFRLVYPQPWDGEGAPHVVVNGTRYNNDSYIDFDAGEEIEFVINAPDYRDGYERVVSIVSGGETVCSTSGEGDNKLVVSNDRFSFTPESNDGFIVYVYWSEYDALTPQADSVNFQVECSGKGNVIFSEDGYEMVDPSNDFARKIVVPASVLDDDGYIDISFEPAETYLLKYVYFNDEEYVAENSHDNPYAKLISESPEFSLNDGIWTYRITDDIDNDKWIDIYVVFGKPDHPEDGQFQLHYPQYWGEGASKETSVEVNSVPAEDGDVFDIVPGQEYVFKLYGPESRKGYDRVVKIISDGEVICSTDGQGDSKLTVTNDQFSYTPDSNKAFTVEIDWCEFDVAEPGDGQFMVTTYVDGGYGSVDVSKYETDLVDPSGNHSHKYYVNSSELAEDGAIQFSFIPNDGCELEAVFMTFKDESWGRTNIYVPEDTDKYYYDALFSEIPEFELVDGIWTYNLDEFPDWAQDKYISLTVVYKKSNTQSADPQFALQADTFGPDGSPECSITLNSSFYDDYRITDNHTVLDYRAGDEISFTLVPPEDRQIDGLVPIVNIYKKDNSCLSSVDGDIEIVKVDGENYKFTFSYTPENDDGFRMEIYWSEYDILTSHQDGFLLQISANYSKPDYYVMTLPEKSAHNPDRLHETACLYDKDTIPEDGIKIELNSDYLPIESVVIIAGKDRKTYFSDSYSASGGLSFSDLDWFDVDGDGIVTLTIPKDSCEFSLYVRINYDTNGGYDLPRRGQYIVDCYQLEEACLEVNGVRITKREYMNFTAGEALNFKFNIPEYGQGYKHYVRIIDGKGDTVKLFVLDGGEFTYTPESERGFRVQIRWTEFEDLIWPDDGQFMVWAESDKSGSIAISDSERNLVSPTNENSIKYLVPVTATANEPVVISFVPDTGYKLKAVTLTRYDGDYNAVVYVPEVTSDYNYYKLMSDNAAFEFVNGIWTYKISKDTNGLDGARFDFYAEFTEAEYSVTMSPDIEHCEATLSADSAGYGDEITVNVIADSGYEFDYITVNGEVIKDTKFTMPDSDVVVNVFCKEICYTITVEDSTGGTATASSATAAPGEKVTVTATPDEGYAFDYITINGEKAEGLEFTMPFGNVTVSVFFKKAEYKITIGADLKNCDATASADSANMGDKITITVDPVEGYEFQYITVNGAAIRDTEFTMPAEDVVVNVYCIKIDYKITAAETVNGTVSVTATANAGDVVTITATPAEGYEIDSITVKGAGDTVIPVDGNEFEMPASDVTVTVTFKKVVVAKNGWVLEDGNYYYYENGTMKTGWVKDGKWYYLDPATGIMVKRWKQIGSKWYYFENSGAMLTGWKSIGGKWYYFDSNGAMVTGWKTIGGTWYLFDSNGGMVTGWKASGGKWYYFEGSGAMVTGWKSIGGKWYYFEGSGAMKTGWLKSGNYWYYLDTSGAMVTGWKLLSGKWYYMESSGVMVTGSKKIGGKTYEFDSNGVCLNP